MIRHASVLMIGLLNFLAIISPVVSQQSSIISLQPRVLYDSSPEPVATHQLLVPVGWQVEGGLYFAPPDYYMNTPSQQIKVISPDGVVLEIGPTIHFYDYVPTPQAIQQWGAKRLVRQSAHQGYIVETLPNDLKQWKQKFEQLLQEKYHDAKSLVVRDVQVIPELNDSYQSQLQPQIQKSRETLGDGSVAGGQFLGAWVSYHRHDRDWEMLLLVAINYFGFDSNVGRQIWWGMDCNVSITTPAGSIQDYAPLLLVVLNSLEETQTWTQIRSEVAASVNATVRRGITARSGIMTDAINYVGRMNQEAYQNRIRSFERTNEAFIRMIREVELFALPGTNQTVQLPSNYKRYYTNGSEYLMTEDVDYDPNRDPERWNSNWQALQVAPRK
jgi:hypothetical protein